MEILSKSRLMLYVKGLDIDINKEASDVIMCKKNPSSYGYENLCTGVSGDSIDSVIRDRRFIIFDSFNIQGYCVTRHKKDDIDIIVICYAVFVRKNGVWQWKECERRGFIDRYSGLSSVQRSLYHECDIFGQTVVPMNNMEDRYAMPFGSKKTLLDYFGGPMIVHADLEDSVITTRLTFSSRKEMNHLARLMSDEKRLKIGDMPIYAETEEKANPGKMIVIAKTAGTLSFEEKDGMAVPAEAEKMMKRYARNWINTKSINQNSEHTCVCSIIQKNKDKVLVRAFCGVWYHAYLQHESQVELYEYKRIIYDAKTAPAKAGKEFSVDAEYPVWCGGMNGTIFQYTRKHIDEWIDFWKKTTTDYAISGDISAKSFSKIHVSPYKIVDICAAIGSDAVFEKLLNLPCPEGADNKNMRKWNDIIMAVLSDEESLEALFPYCDRTQEKLHKILGLPKGTLELFIINCIPKAFILKIQEIMHVSDDTWKYFMNMNSEDLSRFINLFDRRFTRPEQNVLLDVFILLIELFGVENFNAYVKFLKNACSIDFIPMYCTYLEKMSLVKDNRKVCEDVFKKMKWRLSDNELKKAYADMELIYYSTTEEYERLLPKYKKQYTKWETYIYEDEKIQVIYPKDPIEVVKEGIMLNHCLKSYVNAIADGSTNVLFIRRKNNIEKPYYTLEVRKGAIRQCHGFNNCNMSRDVEKFVKKYCAEKNIIFSKGTEALGV